MRPRRVAPPPASLLALALAVALAGCATPATPGSPAGSVGPAGPPGASAGASSSAGASASAAAASSSAAPATVRLAGRVTGAVPDPALGATVPATQLVVRASLPEGGDLASAAVAADGTWALDVPPGRYLVSVGWPAGGAIDTLWLGAAGPGPSRADAQPVEVAAGGATADLAIPAFGIIRLRVEAPGATRFAATTPAGETLPTVRLPDEDPTATLALPAGFAYLLCAYRDEEEHEEASQGIPSATCYGPAGPAIPERASPVTVPAAGLDIVLRDPAPTP